MFEIGEKVVFVDDSPANIEVPKGFICIEEYPDIGDICTITAINLTHPLDPTKKPCVLIAEIDSYNPIWEHRFQKLPKKSTSAEVEKLKKLLNPVPEKVHV